MTENVGPLLAQLLNLPFYNFYYNKTVDDKPANTCYIAFVWFQALKRNVMTYSTIKLWKTLEISEIGHFICIL